MHNTITNSSCVWFEGIVVNFSHKSMSKCAFFLFIHCSLLIWDVLFRLTAYFRHNFWFISVTEKYTAIPIGWMRPSLNEEEANATIFVVKNNHEIDRTVSEKKSNILWRFKVEWRDRGNEGVSRHDCFSATLNTGWGIKHSGAAHVYCMIFLSCQHAVKFLFILRVWIDGSFVVGTPVHAYHPYFHSNMMKCLFWS